MGMRRLLCLKNAGLVVHKHFPIIKPSGVSCRCCCSLNSRSLLTIRHLLSVNESTCKALVPRYLCSNSTTGFVYNFTKACTDLHILGFQQVDSLSAFSVKRYRRGSQRRPESRQGMDPEQFYSDEEANRYTNKPRNIQVQTEMTTMALDIISRTTDSQEKDSTSKLIVDLGCGSGLNLGNIGSKNHFVIGIDISRSMLGKAQGLQTSGIPPQNQMLFGLVQANLGELQCLKTGMADAVISISVLQWFLRYADSSDYGSSLRDFISSVKHCLKPGGSAVCQFYPSSSHDLTHIVNVVTAFNVFHGAIICGYPHQNKAKKLFLLLRKNK